MGYIFTHSADLLEMNLNVLKELMLRVTKVALEGTSKDLKLWLISTGMLE